MYAKKAKNKQNLKSKNVYLDWFYNLTYFFYIIFIAYVVTSPKSVTIKSLYEFYIYIT